MGQQVCNDEACGGDCREQGVALTAPGADIPVRRYGTVPELADDEPAWEIDMPPDRSPRTIAEAGGRLVLLAALAAAVLAGCILYAR